MRCAIRTSGMTRIYHCAAARTVGCRPVSLRDRATHARELKPNSHRRAGKGNPYHAGQAFAHCLCRRLAAHMRPSRSRGLRVRWARRASVARDALAAHAGISLGDPPPFSGRKGLGARGAASRSGPVPSSKPVLVVPVVVPVVARPALATAHARHAACRPVGRVREAPSHGAHAFAG